MRRFRMQSDANSRSSLTSWFSESLGAVAVSVLRLLPDFFVDSLRTRVTRSATSRFTVYRCEENLQITGNVG